MYCRFPHPLLTLYFSMSTRREFLRAATVGGVAGLSVARSAHAQGSGTIKIGLIGSGGRTPERAFGLGGRSSMTDREFGDVFDHHGAIFHYPNDACRLFAFCRTTTGCYNSYDDIIFGSKGTAYWNESKIVGETNWKYEGPKAGGHAEEQVALFNAIRKGERLHSDDYVVKSTTMAVLGQVAAYTGKMIGWQEMLDSQFVFKPVPEECVAGMASPVVPGPNGNYPVPIPGQHAWW